MQKEASYTVELALLMPVIFLAVLLPVYTGFFLYEKTKVVSAYEKEVGSMEEKIRNIRLKKELWEE